MARSTYIHVVMFWNEPIAAFTVKHELVTYLHQRNSLDHVTVWRVHDGLIGGAVLIPSMVPLEDLT